MQYCKQCGHVLEDFELTNNGWDKDLYKHADTTGWTLSLKYPKTFEVSDIAIAAFPSILDRPNPETNQYRFRCLILEP